VGPAATTDYEPGHNEQATLVDCSIALPSCTSGLCVQQALQVRQPQTTAMSWSCLRAASDHETILLCFFVEPMAMMRL
jgi:hypothetical protein